MSDCGPQFITQIWSGFLEKLGTSVSLTLGYHFQSNGQVERVNQEIGCVYAPFGQNDWSRYLPWAEYAQNSLRHSATHLTLFQCVLGYQPPLFPWTANPTNAPAV